MTQPDKDEIIAYNCATPPTQPDKAALADFTQYRRTQIAEMIPWSPDLDLDLTIVSVSKSDKDAGSPKAGDMIARNPKNHADMWLVAAQYFADNFEPAAAPRSAEGMRAALEKICDLYDDDNEDDPLDQIVEIARAAASVKTA